MAVVKMNFLSQALGMQTNVTICVPSFSFADIMNGRQDVYVPGMKYQVLWLLHGGSGDDSDYVNFSNIVRYADDNKIAVVMPADYNAGYADQEGEGLMGGVDLTMTKSDRLQYRESYATHAMILIGVNFDENGRPERWKIENSWGEENGKKGLFVCSEAYFREFVYEGIIRRDLLSDAQRALLEKPPVEINGWESDTL